MSDFGSDLGNAGMQLTGKVLDAILALLKKIYEDARKEIKERSSAEYKLQQQQLKKIKDDMKRVETLKKFEGMTGLINYDDIMKAKAAGLSVSVLNVHCNKEQLNDLSEMCKRNGVLISSVEDVRSRELGGEKTYTLICKADDVAKLSELVDTMVDAKRIEALNVEKEKILAKGSEMSEMDRVLVNQLNSEMQSIRNRDMQSLNSMQLMGAIDKAIDGERHEAMSFDEAINRLTGKKIDKDVTVYVADATDPNKYLSAHSQEDEYRGKPYIKTDYTVYNGDKVVMQANDGRFDGRDKYYWVNLRKQMQEQGGFGDSVIKFYDKDEFDKYRESYQRQQQSEIAPLLEATDDSKGLPDYESACRIVTNKIEECNCRYDAETKSVIDNSTGKTVSAESIWDSSNSRADCARLAEALVCSRQLENYMELQHTSDELQVAQVNLTIEPAGTLEHAKAQAEYDALKSRYDKLKENEQEFIIGRQNVNAFQSKDEVETEIEEKQNTELSNGIETHEVRVAKSIEEWDADIQQIADESMESMIENEMALTRAKVSEEFIRADTLDVNADFADTSHQRASGEAHADRVKENAETMQDRLNSKEMSVKPKGKGMEH